jgi:hypothetical protein
MSDEGGRQRHSKALGAKLITDETERAKAERAIAGTGNTRSKAGLELSVTK